jgi:hypothetical protein
MQYFPGFLPLSDLLRSLANDELVGPLTIELTQKMPIFIGILPIREAQLPRLLPRRFSSQDSGEKMGKTCPFGCESRLSS